MAAATALLLMMCVYQSRMTWVRQFFSFLFDNDDYDDNDVLDADAGGRGRGTDRRSRPVRGPMGFASEAGAMQLMTSPSRVPSPGSGSRGGREEAVSDRSEEEEGDGGVSSSPFVVAPYIAYVATEQRELRRRRSRREDTESSSDEDVVD
jgi:hypothetical protein